MTITNETKAAMDVALLAADQKEMMGSPIDETQMSCVKIVTETKRLFDSLEGTPDEVFLDRDVKNALFETTGKVMDTCVTFFPLIAFQSIFDHDNFSTILKDAVKAITDEINKIEKHIHEIRR